jgi:hypothetical protein
MMHLKLLEKPEQAKPKISRWKERIKKLRKWRLREQYIRSIKWRIWFVFRDKQIEKPLAKLAKREIRLKLIQIRHEKGDNTTDTIDIQREYLKIYIPVNWKI